jgi:predicted flap endonuclease-1-like 5' DNA nuclease
LSIVAIAWMSGWMQHKKEAELSPPSTIIETPKAESITAAEAQVEPEPAPAKKVESQIAEEKVETAQPPVQEIKTPLKETKDRGSKIIDIEGIGPVYAQKLNAINIYTTTELLQAGATPRGRREIAEKTAISNNLILRWINMADLFRIKGVGEEYSDLLEAAGVDTVVELSKRVPENLHPKMLEANAAKNLVRRTPSLNEVKQWVEEAKTLPRKVEY